MTRSWHLIPLLVTLAAIVAASASASQTDRLEQVSHKWQSARAAEIPLEVFLRPIVAEDPSFNPDPGLAIESLEGELRTTWLGLQYLLTPGMKAQFLGLSTDELRTEWLRRYWRLRDPTPTTPLNERYEEHQRRVLYARHNYTWKNEPFWDERGRIYIIFGRPDTVVSDVPDIREGTGYIPAREDWLYLDEEWVAQFERPSPRGPWVYGRSSQHLSHRPDLVREDRKRLGYDDPLASSTAEGRDRQGDLLGFEDERSLMLQKDPDRLLNDDLIENAVRSDLRAQELLRKEKLAIQMFDKQVESGDDRFVMEGTEKRFLWYVIDVDIYQGPPGRMRVEVHYQFNLQDLTFQWQDSLYVAQYRIEGILFDRQVRQAGRDEYTETLKADEFQSTTKAHLLPGQLNFEVAPGTYRMALRLVDLYSDDEGAYTTDVRVPIIEDNALALSDLQMASRIVYAGSDWVSRFVKNDRLVVPNPIGVYRRGHELTGYFEIYGLTLDPESLCHYQVTYRILPRGKVQAQGWLPPSASMSKPFASSSFSGTGNTSMRIEELRIDVENLQQDIYDLVLTVEDLVSGTEATTRSAFSIID
jgi:GWxTD domain-containing protein